MLLYGPPGTGKTMLAKAVANHTTAAFIRVVGSEFVQKYLGEVCCVVINTSTYKICILIVIFSLCIFHSYIHILIFYFAYI